MLTTGLECDFEYVGRAMVGSLPRLRGGRVLAEIHYSDEFRRPTHVASHPSMTLHVARRAHEGFSEVWRTPRDVHAGTYDGLVYSHDGEFLFCAGYVPVGATCASATRAAYESVFQLCEHLEYSRIFRMWNFIPDINVGNAHGLENYRDFCAGRAEAFERCSAMARDMPAATGVGSLGGAIGFYLLAARCGRTTHLENPRQQPAYTYPRRYGPRSPSFSRGTFLTGAQGGDHLFVSGTASIVGHETVHVGDVEKQTETSLHNIANLISRSNLANHGLDAGATLSDLSLVKAYVRHHEHIAAVRRICSAALSPRTELAILNVDICRSDLLVEIEGIVRGVNLHTALRQSGLTAALEGGAP